MTRRLACPPAPGPLEAYAAQFDDLFGTLAQRMSFRDSLQGLLAPRERNKTLTALAGAEPIVGAQHPAVQKLQFFLSESPWEADQITARRLEVLFGDPATCPHDGGVLVIDETGDRKDGTKTAHVGRQYLGGVPSGPGKIDNGIVAVSSLWADERVYYPLHVAPYTPAARLAKGKADPAFRTKPQIGVDLIDAALAAGVSFRAVVADSFYGENLGFAEALHAAELPYVVALKATHAIWASADAVHNPQEALATLRWSSPEEPGDWTPVERRFRDGHTETWWAVELTFGPYGPKKATRIVVATTDPASLPAWSTWYLLSNLPHPDAPQATESPIPPADLAEIVRLDGLRIWVEQGYKHAKGELGWADFQVRADAAIRRHWALVCCAFAFCWRAWFDQAANAATDTPPAETAALAPDDFDAGPVGEKIRSRRPGRRRPQHGGRHTGLVATDAPTGARLAGSLVVSGTLLACLVERAPAPGGASNPGLGRRRAPTQPISPHLTNYRYTNSL